MATRFTLLMFAAGVLGLMTPANAGAQAFWSAPVTVSETEVAGPDVAVDGSGNAVAVWTRYVGAASVIRVSRYTAATRAWGAPVDLSAAGLRAEGARVASDPGGNAVVTWVRSNGTHDMVQAAYYSAGLAAWSAGTDLSAAGQRAIAPDVGMDGSGNAVAVWLRFDGANYIVQTARFTAATATWSAPQDLSAHGAPASAVALAVDSGGAAAVAWVLGFAPSFNPNRAVQVARYDPAHDAWSAAASLATARAIGQDVLDPSVAIDVSGNVIAVWSRVRADVGLPSVIQSALYIAATATWTAFADLTPADTAGAERPKVVMDRGGHAIAVWARFNRGIQTRRYSPGTGWGPMVVLSAPGETQVLAPTIVIDGNGSAVAGWQLYDDFGNFYPKSAFFSAATGAWTGSIDLPRDSAADRVLAIGGGDQVVAAWIPGWPGMVRASTATVPAAPSLQPATINRPIVTLTWTPPISGPAPTAYAIVVSASPDGLPVAMLPVGTLTSVQGQVPDGTYFVRVVATVAGTTIPSNQVAVVMGPPAPQPPLPPESLVVSSVVGSLVTLRWTIPPIGPAPTNFLLEGGLNPGQVLASQPTGSAAPVFTVAAPAGSFYLRMRALNGTVSSAASNEVLVHVGVPVVPSAPANLLGLVDGTTLTLVWTNTYGGGAPTNVTLTVSGAANGSAPLGLTDTFSFAGVPAGTYTFSVVATSAFGGLSAPSNAVTLTVPAPCSGAPQMVTNFAAHGVGRTLFLRWDPPASGAAPTVYVLSATGTYAASVPTPLKALSGAVPPGTYNLSVAAANACGAGPGSPVHTVVVP